jgi:hypothetical protein
LVSDVGIGDWNNNLCNYKKMKEYWYGMLMFIGIVLFITFIGYFVGVLEINYHIEHISTCQEISRNDTTTYNWCLNN